MRFYVTLKIDGLECIKEISSHNRNTLHIGPDVAELIECVDPPFWDALCRSNCFQCQANQIQSITLIGLQLDDWDVLCRELLKFGSRLTSLAIHQCDLTERGAHTLGRFLEESGAFGQPAFKIEQLVLCGLKGSNAWVKGLHENHSLRTIEFDRLCSYEILCFIQQAHKHSRHKKRIIWKVGNEEVQNCHGLEKFSLLRNQNEDNETMDCCSDSMITLQLCFSAYSERMTPDLIVLQALGGLLRSTPVEMLLLVGTLPNMKEYDFLADAVLCQVIFLQSNYVPLGLASLIRKDGCLKEIYLTGIRPRNEKRLEALLSFADLTHLDRLETSWISVSQELEKAFLDLCRHVGQNKGPRHLAISLEGESDDESDDDNDDADETDEDVGEIGESVGETTKVTKTAKNAAALKKFATALGDNDKIQRLEIQFGFYVTSQTLEHLIRLMSTMPALLSLDISSITRITGSQTDVEDCKELALSLATMSKTVLHFSLPRTIMDEKFIRRIKEIPYRRMLRCGNDVSDGIWSHALNHATKKDLSVMFGIVRELPGLIQQCNAVRMIEPPQFSVPHHPNCPACCKRQKKTK